MSPFLLRMADRLHEWTSNWGFQPVRSLQKSVVPKIRVPDGCTKRSFCLAASVGQLGGDYQSWLIPAPAYATRMYRRAVKRAATRATVHRTCTWHIGIKIAEGEMHAVGNSHSCIVGSSHLLAAHLRVSTPSRFAFLREHTELQRKEGNFRHAGKKWWPLIYMHVQ